MLDPLRTPLFAPAKSVARLVAAELGRLPQGRVRPTRHPSWSVQRRLRRSGLLPIRQATVGFGPFTYLGKTLLPDNHAIRVEQACSVERPDLPGEFVQHPVVASPQPDWVAFQQPGSRAGGRG